MGRRKVVFDPEFQVRRSLRLKLSEGEVGAPRRSPRKKQIPPRFGGRVVKKVPKEYWEGVDLSRFKMEDLSSDSSSDSDPTFEPEEGSYDRMLEEIENDTEESTTTTTTDDDEQEGSGEDSGTSQEELNNKENEKHGFDNDLFSELDLNDFEVEANPPPPPKRMKKAIDAQDSKNKKAQPTIPPAAADLEQTQQRTGEATSVQEREASDSDSMSQETATAAGDAVDYGTSSKQTDENEKEIVCWRKRRCSVITISDSEDGEDVGVQGKGPEKGDVLPKKIATEEAPAPPPENDDNESVIMIGLRMNGSWKEEVKPDLEGTKGDGDINVVQAQEPTLNESETGCPNVSYCDPITITAPRVHDDENNDDEQNIEIDIVPDNNENQASDPKSTGAADMHSNAPLATNEGSNDPLSGSSAKDQEQTEAAAKQKAVENNTCGSDTKSSHAKDSNESTSPIDVDAESTSRIEKEYEHLRHWLTAGLAILDTRSNTITKAVLMEVKAALEKTLNSL